MKNRYRLYRRSNGTYYSFDSNTGKQQSLKTKNKDIADRLMAAKNQASDTAQLNRAMAKIYASGADPELMTRTWSEVCTEYASRSVLSTRPRVERAFCSKPFEDLRRLIVNETRYSHFKTVLNHPRAGNSTNHYLRRLQNFALRARWLFDPVISELDWPKVIKKKTIAISAEEHARIVASENNVERRLYYQMMWETGGSQTDVANLHRDDINIDDQTITFIRAKLDEREEGGEQCGISKLVIGPRIQAILDQCPREGYLFPIFKKWSSGHRTTEFARRCRLAGLKNRQLKGYRYAWAERARRAGMPEREAIRGGFIILVCVVLSYLEGAACCCRSKYMSPITNASHSRPYSHKRHASISSLGTGEKSHSLFKNGISVHPRDLSNNLDVLRFFLCITPDLVRSAECPRGRTSPSDGFYSKM